MQVPCKPIAICETGKNPRLREAISNGSLAIGSGMGNRATRRSWQPSGLTMAELNHRLSFAVVETTSSCRPLSFLRDACKLYEL